MLNCRTCRKAVAPSAIICPHCGATYPGGRARAAMKQLLALIIFIALIAILVMFLGSR